MRVVIDTNILVSFAIRPSTNLEKIFDHIADHGPPLVSEATIAELFSVLNRRKFRKYLSLNSVIDYVEWYAATSESVEIRESVIVYRDPRDDKFLDVAVNGRADMILSGDADLLVLNPFRGIRIVDPAAFAGALSSGRN